MRTPYRLDLSAIVLRRLSTNVVDVFDGTTYRRLLGDPRDPTLLTVTQPRADAVIARVDGPQAQDIDPAAAVRRALGIDVDLGAFYAGTHAFGWLDRLAASARGVKPPRYPSLWESIVNAIVYQHVSIHAAGAILRRMIERYSARVDVGDAALFAFPGAPTIVDADPLELRALGLSLNKIAALTSVAGAIVDGSFTEAALEPLPTDALMRALVAHRGIGPWTAAVIALRGFGRLDVFPMHDSGAAASLRSLSGEPALDPAPIVAALAPQQGMLYYHLLIGRLIARGEITVGA